MARGPFAGLLWPRDLFPGFIGQRTFYRSSMARGPITEFLWPDDLLQVFYGQKNFYRSSMARGPFAGLLWPKELFQVSLARGSITYYRSSMVLLQIFYDLVQVFCGKRTFYSFLWSEGIFRSYVARMPVIGFLFWGRKTFYRSSMDIVHFTGLI